MLDWRYIMPRLTECARVRARLSERACIIVNVYHSRTKIRTRDVASYLLLCNLVCVCGRRWGVEGERGEGGFCKCACEKTNKRVPLSFC